MGEGSGHTKAGTVGEPEPPFIYIGETCFVLYPQLLLRTT